ncbi:hypothetical protein [Pontibacter rugosus]
MIDITNVLFLSVIGLYAILLGMILTYVYYDAEMRGMNGFVVTTLAFFAGTVLGTLIWIALRPKLKPQPIPVRS